MMDAGLCNADGFVTRKHQGTTPLSVAIRNGRDATVRYLLQKGANVNFHDDQWLSPLHVAAGVTRPARLKPNEAKGQMTAKESRVQYAQDANVSGSVEDDVSIVQLLVEAKAAVRARDHTRWTPLHYAVCMYDVFMPLFRLFLSEYTNNYFVSDSFCVLWTGKLLHNAGLGGQRFHRPVFVGPCTSRKRYGR